MRSLEIFKKVLTSKVYYSYNTVVKCIMRIIQ